MDSKSLGKRLRIYRASHGWTRDVCSPEMGITSNYLADIERGDKVPAMETFIRILNTLHASADDVLQDSLVVGYEAKSNDILKKLDGLDPTHRKQALDILDSVISSFQEH